MSITALKNSLAKYPSLVAPYTEEELHAAYDYLVEEMTPIWGRTRVWSFREAIEDCDLTKGSGHPFHYVAPTKEQALDKFAGEIESLVHRVLAGDESVDMPCSMTLKDELRSEDRVKAHKTRAFNASNFVHLLASKMLFGDQNEKIHANRDKHPITLGITVPGSEFVDAVLSLGKRAGDSDGDGYDLRFNLGLARVIRDARKFFLPKSYWEAVDLLYDAIYAGETITLGFIYRLLCQKSGWNNTGDDNSLALWLAFYLVFRRLGLEREFRAKQIVLKINGDDNAVGNKTSVDFNMETLAIELAKNGVMISYEHKEMRSAYDITFLSHHLRERFVPRFGDVVVAAGNRAKLLSSLNWIKPCDTLSFEESCLAHLLGIRLCLWPWKHDFDDVDEIIDSFLSKVPLITLTMKQLLKARLTEEQVLFMHITVEGGFVPEIFSPPFLLCEVDQVTSSLIKKLIV